MYKVIFTEKSRKFLRKIEDSERRRIISSIDRCKIRPHAHVKKLVDLPYFRLRVGKYRVIMDIRSEKLVIIIVNIAHRKNVY